MIERVIFILGLFLCIILFGTLILLGCESNYHYAYIDYNGNLGLASRCRHNQCEDLDFNVVSVKDYIDIRKK